MTADRQQLFRDEIEDPYICLVTLTHPFLEPPVRVATNSSDVVSNGETFLRGRLDVVPPNIKEGEQSARISIANVDRRIGLAAARLITPAQILIQVVNAEDPDTIDIEYPPMWLSNITGDALVVTGELTSQINLRDEWPNVRATKTVAPGIYL